MNCLQLVAAELVEPVQRMARKVRLVVGDAVGIAVVGWTAVPLLAGQQAVDELEAGGADRGDGEAGDADLGGEDASGLLEIVMNDHMSKCG